MLGIGMPELIIILVVALIVFGPKRLPDLVKSIARGMGEFKKATHEIKTSLNVDEDLREIKRTFDEEMYRTMDKAGSGKTDPFKSRQEEIDEQRERQGESSGDDKEHSCGEDQAKDKEFDSGVKMEDHQVQDETILENESGSGKDEAVEGKGG